MLHSVDELQRWLLAHAESLGGQPGPLALAGDDAAEARFVPLEALERLVGQADTLAVVAKLRAMAAAPQRSGAAVLEDTLH